MCIVFVVLIIFREKNYLHTTYWSWFDIFQLIHFQKWKNDGKLKTEVKVSFFFSKLEAVVIVSLFFFVGGLTMVTHIWDWLHFSESITRLD